MRPHSFLCQTLRQREHTGNPVEVAILGGGWFGSGFVREMMRWPGMVPRIIFERSTQKGIDALQGAGIPKTKIEIVSRPEGFERVFRKNYYAVTSDFQLLEHLPGIEIVFDATGDILSGAQGALLALKQGIHFVTTSSELDATVGYVLRILAEENRAIYSNCDGDQPGVLARMIDEVKLFGFEITAAGNGKGFLNHYTKPEDIMPYVMDGASPRKITSFTDGTKQSLELAVLANGIGLVPDKRGMHGLKTTKADLLRDLTSVVSREGVVEYFMGTDVNYGGSVFVIGKREEPLARRDLAYLRRGEGPYYLFFRDYHLCYLEAPRSVAEVALFRAPTIAPLFLNADVIAVAKRDIRAGERLDGIGGYMVYGLIDRYEAFLRDNLLPLGLAEFAVAKKNISRDTPLTRDMVDFPSENIVLTLRGNQDTFAREKERSPKKVRQRSQAER